MIRLHKADLPDPLRESLAARSARLKELLRDSAAVPQSLATWYRNSEVKNAIRAESHAKCAYCESKIDHVYYGDVEHILPKGMFPELTLEYSNLTYACALCNNAKLDYFDEQYPLLHPYDDEPSDHLVALGVLVLGKPGDGKGFTTEEVVKLNRAELVERRKERVHSVHRLAQAFAQMPEGARKETVKAQLLEEARDENEYAFVVRGYLATVLGLQGETACDSV